MNYNPQIHHRRSIRLQGYDYSQFGVYFVTICLQERACLLGRIVEDVMQCNDAGRMIEHWWQQLTSKYPHVDLDEYAVMPNHFHGVIVVTERCDLAIVADAVGATDVVGAALCGRPSPHEPTGQPHGVAPTTTGDLVGASTCADAPTLGDIVGWFKTMTTNAYIRGVKECDWPPFPGRFWQRNYYEHIVRNEDELNRIRAYIASNPLRWALDRENPQAIAAQRGGAHGQP